MAKQKIPQIIPRAIPKPDTGNKGRTVPPPPKPNPSKK